MTNEDVRSRIQNPIEVHGSLLSMVKKRVTQIVCAFLKIVWHDKGNYAGALLAMVKKRVTQIV